MAKRMLTFAILGAVGIAAGVIVLLPHASTPHAALTGSSCSGPSGTAYVTDPGYEGFTAIDTATCQVIQTYNVDDLQVPSDPGDYNYDGAAEGIALSGTTLWFAVTGTSNVAAIDTTTLNPSDYNPAETLIPVGLFPQQLAVSPDGSQVWVAESGPQTSTSPVSGVAVIDTSSDTVVDNLSLHGDPTDIAFSPDGSQAYVTTSSGLFVFDTSSAELVASVPGLGDPQSVAVAPDGKAIYVTESALGLLATIDPATDHVVRTTAVGQLPWQSTVSSDSSTVYVASPDSDTVSVVDAANGDVVRTIDVTGDPDSVALTPAGAQLWVGGQSDGSVTVLDADNGALVGVIDLGGDGPQSGDGLEPTGIVITG